MHINSPKNIPQDCKKGWLKTTHSPIQFLAGSVLAHLIKIEFVSIILFVDDLNQMLNLQQFREAKIR